MATTNAASGQANTAVGSGAVPPNRGENIGTNAVSYTHLRAHETVLDLVCRLLLEKKKNNKKHTT